MVKTAWPELFVVAVAGAILGAPGPAIFARLTGFMASGFPTVSLTVTVTADVEVPLAGTKGGLATALLWLGSMIPTGPARMAPLDPTTQQEEGQVIPDRPTSAPTFCRVQLTPSVVARIVLSSPSCENPSAPMA